MAVGIVKCFRALERMTMCVRAYNLQEFKSEYQILEPVNAPQGMNLIFISSVWIRFRVDAIIFDMYSMPVVCLV